MVTKIFLFVISIYLNQWYNVLVTAKEVLMKYYFAVETKCGHVGRDKCIYIWFAVRAENGRDAAAKARDYKRVKHHHKDAIRQVRKISFAEYKQLQRDNMNDAYLQCKNTQQQRLLSDLENRIEIDKYTLSKRNNATQNRDTSFSLKRNAMRIKDAILQIQESCYNDIVS